MASKYYKLNANNKTITLDSKVVPTALDEKTVQMYVNAGYIVRYKSEKRAAAARKRIADNGGKIGKKKAEDK